MVGSKLGCYTSSNCLNQNDRLLVEFKQKPNAMIKQSKSKMVIYKNCIPITLKSIKPNK